MPKKVKPASGMEPDNALRVEQLPDETGAKAVARKVLDPGFRHALTASAFADKALGSTIEHPGLMDYVDHVLKLEDRAEAGDLALASRLLASQAITLDAMFTELARRAAINMGEYMDASQKFGRLALKAQSNCRTTLEALAKLHQPREQTVRHVHVNEGGQAVVADHFHHHTGGLQNGKSVKQSHAAGPAGTSAAMLGEDAKRDGMPITSGEGADAVPHARRHQSRRT